MLKGDIMTKLFLSTFLLITLSLVTTIITAAAHNKFVLITSLYNENDNRRIQEYFYCLKRNNKHPSIKKIHVVYDTSKDTKTNNNKIIDFLKKRSSITITYTHGRPTFNFLFDLANTHYNGKKIIVSNADIYFDQSLKLLNNFDLTNKFLSLTRWEVLATGKLFPIFLSHAGPFGADTWIFNSPIEKFQDLNFGLGTSDCDFRIIYQAYKSNLTVLNPCLDIKCCHMHLSNIRHYPIEDKKNSRAWARPGKMQDQKAEIVILKEVLNS